VSDEAQSGAGHIAPRPDDAEALYEHAPCGYLTATPSGLITRANQTFLDLTGYRRDELVGRRTFASLLSGGGRIYHETHYAPMLQMHGSVHEIALDIVAADGRRLPVLVNSVVDSGAILTAVFDATARREYERELLRARERAEDAVARARSLAQALQQTLIPPALPDVAGLDLAAAYRPAGDGTEVGGDFYDVFQVGPEEWVVVIGDVCGKGIQAAIVTSLARHTVRAASIATSLPSDALDVLNEILLQSGESRFITVALLRLRRHGDRGWEVAFSTGGHALPIRLPVDGKLDELGEPGALVGVFEDPGYATSTTVLAPGESLLLFTDGVTEARGAQDFFGQRRMLDSARRHLGTAASLVDGVLADVLGHQDGWARDDIAIVAIRVPSPGE
jgi:sigma-B regulation protein RsbU (phosphoserine phosphatase)